MTDLLTKIGYDDKEILTVQSKFDIDKITETVENSSSVEEASPAINALYPEIEIEKLQEQLDFIRGQVEAAFKEQAKTPVELTSEEIDTISGGGVFQDIGNFFKDHWKAILIGAAIVVGAAVALAVIGGEIGSLAGVAGAVIVNS